MPKYEPMIEPVFSKPLGMAARKLALSGALTIIEAKDFPPGVAVHEDGSTVYDPKKPYVLFAVRISTWEGHRQWQDAVDENNALVAQRVA